MSIAEDLAQNIVESFLQYVRDQVSQNSLNENRLPPWVKAAKVRVGWVNYSLVFVLEEGSQGDSYEIRGPVSADTAVLLDTDDFYPEGSYISVRGIDSCLLTEGTYTDENNTTFVLRGKPAAWYDCGYAGYHGPLGLINIFFQRRPDNSPDVTAMRFVPFALYVHESDSADLVELWQKCEPDLTNGLLDIHNSSIGDFYESRQQRSETFEVTKKRSVIVLGKDTGVELQELMQVRDYLRGQGYQAELIKDLPEIPMMSNEEKVRLWSLVSRFCVMIDRRPAGHIAEFIMLREQRSILAFLRPQGSGSTYMIGDDRLVDQNFIRLFEFDGPVLGVLDNVIEWAENLAQKRSGAYNQEYPWR